MMLRSSVFARVSVTLAASFIISCGGSDSGSDAGTGGSSAGSGGSSAGSGGGAAGMGGGAAGMGGGAAGSGGAVAGTGGGPAGTGGGPAGTGGGAAGSGGGAQAGRGGSGGAGQAGRGGTGGGAAGTTGTAGRGGTGGAVTASAMMNFFVTSETSTTANLGGLAAADDRCQRLAAAVGQGAKTWRAYLCVASPATNARDRIGAGPYYNSAGALLAADKDALHARSGDSTLFIDERGARINGQWSGSPTPNQHDILTGCNNMGMLMAGNTCGDWTSTTGMSLVGHADGLGQNMNSAPPNNQWAGAHEGFCNDTAMRGGAGKTYCFVGP